MPKRGGSISLTSYDDIFETDESRAESQLERVQNISLSDLVPFKNHPFKVQDDEAMVLFYYTKKGVQLMTNEEMMMQMKNLLGIQRNPSMNKMPEGQEKAKQTANSIVSTTELVDALCDLSDLFCDCAVALSCIAKILVEEKEPQKLPSFADLYGYEDEEDDQETEDDCDDYESPTVIYAAPGRSIELMSELEAIDRFPWKNDEQHFQVFPITDRLEICYTEPTLESDDEITILYPVYVARVNKEGTDTEEISAKDMIDTVTFLEEHAVTITDEAGRNSCGFWLPKHKKED